MAVRQKLNLGTPAVGKITKGTTPAPSHEPPLWEALEFRTCRYGGIEMYTSDDGKKGPGMCKFDKNAAGGGEERNAAGHVYQKYTAGYAKEVMGEVVDFHNGNKLSSGGNGLFSVYAFNSTAESIRGGGESTTRGLTLPRATCAHRTDRAKMFSVGGSYGMMIGGNLGMAADEISIASGTNVGIGASKGVGISGEHDCTIGSQQGCMHVYGHGLAIGSTQGPATMESYGGPLSLITSAGMPMNVTPGAGGILFLSSKGAPTFLNAAGGPIAMDGVAVFINSGFSTPGKGLPNDLVAATTSKPQIPSIPLNSLSILA